jgi:dTDP-4-dehydrorhamnose 3,5-epimerase-like enzyme
VVDIRPNSKTFRKSMSVELMPTNGTAVLIEHGLGHAFISLEEGSTISYLLTSNYAPNEEYAINPLDKELGIDWQNTNLTISDKDKLAFSIGEMLQIGKLPK